MAQKFRMHANFDHADAQEIARILRRFCDAIDRSEKMVGHKWHFHMPHNLFDKNANKVGAWTVTV